MSAGRCEHTDSLCSSRSLAAAHLGLGENDDARKHLAIAMRNSTTRRDHDLYAAKLDRLNRVH